VDCDANCQATPGIYAAGDVASWPNAHFGTRPTKPPALRAPPPETGCWADRGGSGEWGTLVSRGKPLSATAAHRDGVRRCVARGRCGPASTRGGERHAGGRRCE
jgi:hypothetical protein